jgi:hypothetical protein
MTSWVVAARILGTLLCAITFALIFAGPIHIVMRRRIPKISFVGVFSSVSLAIFVEYWLAAAGGGLIFDYAAGSSANDVVTVVAILAVSSWTFLVGSWLLGWGLGAPRNVRFEHGATANAVLLLCNSALVALAVGLDSVLR